MTDEELPCVHSMARAEDTELIETFEEFYRSYYRNEIGELAQQYPTESKSLHVDWRDLYRFDPDLADDFRNKPEQLRDYAEEALRLYDLPVDISLGQAHVRVAGLPETTDIRAIRANNRGTLVAVQGIVRKATEVRPKITTAAFECQRCGTLTRIPQSDGEFQEPHDCQGCERQGPFRVNFDQSEFVDAQKLRVQESPEGLRGGETPQSIDVNIEDDITGAVTAGDHVTVTGVLKLDQRGNDREKSPMFDVYMNGLTVEIEDEQFEEMDISDEDKTEIVELANRDDIYDQMVGAIAPSIYGYEAEKLAMTLQLFSGVTKHLPDGSRIRGDLHMLLIGDPGTGKCQKYDTKVAMGDGVERQIGNIVEEHLDDPVEIDDGYYQNVDLNVLTADGSHIRPEKATRVWKREVPEQMYRIRTASGREVETTPSHPLFVQDSGSLSPVVASDLSEGELIATPRMVPTTASDRLEVTPDEGFALDFSFPDTLTEDLSRLLGYVLGEGHVNGNTVVITSVDEEIIDDVSRSYERLELDHRVEPHQTKSHVSVVKCSSFGFVHFFEKFEPAILENSAQQRVPDPLFRASRECKREFLKAYVDGECSVSSTEREITVASMSKELLEGVRSLLLSFGIQSQLHPRSNGSYRLRISGKHFETYLSEIGFVTGRKTNAAQNFASTTGNTNTDVIPGAGSMLNRIREALDLSQHDCGIPRTTYQHYERGDRHPSRSSLRAVVSAFEDRIERLEEMRDDVSQDNWEAIVDVRSELNISQSSLAAAMKVTQTAISCDERNETVPDGGNVTATKTVVLERIDEALSVTTDVRRLRQLVDAEIYWDRIESIETVDPDYEWVYDLEVSGTHNYISNGVISHNSMLLQYIRQIAPRSVYTSGKGSSAAGLTAAAVRDDFGDGQQWTLEAGALVLADQGIAAIDELDKMDAGDRSAMHEGLEQQSISVSKAGINATLKSRCSLLGAANPKYGRFDQFEAIGEQIDLEPTLISRFDLIFTVTDQPDEERDADLAEHILQTNYAGELHTHRTETSTSNYTAEEVETVTEEVAPTIEPDLFRKYVAHAKRSCFPTMTEEAKAELQEFYVDLRAEGTGEDAPVPVTARKLEALVRLSEASARVRLSDTVEVEDAQRATEIARSSLEDIGMDPETGEFDADVVETGTSKSQRDRIRSIKNLIAEIEAEYDEGAPADVVVERAEEEGMELSKAEHEIDKLKQKGEVYEPQTGHLRTT